MTENLNRILIDQTNFTGLVSILNFKIMNLLNSVLESVYDEEDFLILKLNMDNLILCCRKFVANYFIICNSLLNEENYNEMIDNLIELLRLVRNTLIHLSGTDLDGTNPCRNLILRDLIERIFDPIFSQRVRI
jgi:hypothetical protein